MEKAYLITIDSTQDVNGEKETMEVTTYAALEGVPDDYTIIYTDEAGDMIGAVNKLHVQKDRRVTIAREGDYQTNLVLEPNVRHQTLYQTPHGSFMLGVCALQVESKMTLDGGTLFFRYCTDVDMVPLGEVTFKITLKKCAHSEAKA